MLYSITPLIQYAPLYAFLPESAFFRQKEKSIGIAEKYVDKLNQTSKEQSLPPMSPMLRATVHTFIAEKHPDIQTESKGFGKYRYITINKK